MNLYETQKILNEYLLFHYGTHTELNPFDVIQESYLNFPQRTVLENIDCSKTFCRALDLGCSVGRSAFELSSFCEEVLGIDYSKAFIQAAEKLRVDHNLKYEINVEAGKVLETVARIPDASRPENICFEVGDAMNLPNDIGRFDVIHAANLICRLPEPVKLLKNLPELLNDGGLLVVTTPCTWLGEFTEPDNWPKGSTLEWLKNNLSSKLLLKEVKDMPFVILEHHRKYQFSIAQASVWAKED